MLSAQALPLLRYLPVGRSAASLAAAPAAKFAEPSLRSEQALRASAPIEILDVANVATSFPGFVDTARAAGLGVEAL